MYKLITDLLTYPTFTYEEFLDNYVENAKPGICKEIARLNKQSIEVYLKGVFRIPLRYPTGRAVPFDRAAKWEFYRSLLVPWCQLILSAGLGWAAFGITGAVASTTPVIAMYLYHRTNTTAVNSHLDVAFAVMCIGDMTDELELRKK